MKRPLAVDLSHAGSHVSARALQAILLQVKEEGVPEHFSATHQRREKQRLLDADSLFGPVIRELQLANATGHGTTAIAVAHPLALLQKCLTRSPSFSAFVRRVLEGSDYRCHIIMYSDAVTPGQVLQGDQSRKTECVYWSIKEFGYPTLSHEESYKWRGAYHLRLAERPCLLVRT